MGTPPHIEIIKKSLINRLRDYKFNDASIEDWGNINPTYLNIGINITVVFYNEYVEAKCWLPTNEETITQELLIIEYDDSTQFPDLLVDRIVQWDKRLEKDPLLEQDMFCESMVSGQIDLNTLLEEQHDHPTTINRPTHGSEW